MVPRVRLSVLGAIRLTTADGTELAAVLTQPRRVALLVHLALAQRQGAHRRDTLLALFWPEQDEPHARNALNQAVFFLRRTLGADFLISRGDEELLLDPGQLWCDAREFEALLDAGRTAEALELHRGPFLESFHVSDVAPELERWVDGERDRLERRYARALQDVAEAREAAGDAAGAVTWYRKLAAHDPLSAHAALGLIRTLAAAGEPAAALQQARIHEMLLREELHASPDPRITALVRELQAAGAAASGAPTSGTASRSLIQTELRPPAMVGATTATPSECVAVSNEGARDEGGDATAAAASHGHGVGVGSTPSTTVGPPAARRPARFGISIGLLVLASVAVPAALLSHLLRRADPSDLRIACVAVLPFDNLSRDSTLEPLADAITDATITELARYEGLKVISRTSVLQYRHPHQPLPEIGRALGCDGIIEGSVTRDGRILRVDAQMLHAPEDRHLWAESYEGDTSNVLGLEERVSAAAARHVEPLAALAPPEVPAARRPDPLAYAFYLRGRDAFRSRNAASLREASMMFHAAIARDSMFAGGYAGLADTYNWIAMDGYLSSPVLLDSAHLLAERALAVDSNSSDAHVSIAGTFLQRFDWRNAEAHYRRAIQLQPGNPLAHHWYAMLLVVLDRREDAVREIRRAVELDPLSPAANVKAGIEVWAGMREPRGPRPPPHIDGAQQLQTPTHPGMLAATAIRRAREHHCPEAYELNTRAQELAPDNSMMMVGLVGVDLLCGKTAEARALLTRVERRPDAGWTALHISEVFALEGERDSAFAWLDRSQWSLATLYELRTSGSLKPLRTDPRYAALWAKLGLH